MFITCMLLPISARIEPTIEATSPDTPESISSKIIAGSPELFASTDFRQSITLDSSPPEAHFDSSSGSTCLLALKRNLMSSIPEGPGAGKGVTEASNLAWGIPSL